MTFRPKSIDRKGSPRGRRPPQRLTPDALKHLVRAAGCQPVERDTLYRRIERGKRFRDWTRTGT